MADRPLRVVLVVAETTGGIARHVRQLTAQLVAFKHEVTLVAPETSLAAIDPPRFDLATRALPVGSPRQVRVVRRELRLSISGADVIHAHGLRAGAVAVAASRPIGVRTPKPVVVTWHNAPLLEGFSGLTQRRLMRYVARHADLTLGASPDLTAAALASGARSARDTFVLAPPLDGPPRPRAEVRDELGLRDRPMVLAVGRLQAQKRFDVLIDAAARWADDPSRPVVVLVGGGPDEAALRGRAESARAPVRFLGERNDVADLLAAADVVALPSAWEARSLVAQEALLAGVPLVATRVGGLPDLLGDAAVLVPVGDPLALGEAIIEVVGDATLRDRLVRLGRERAAGWPSAEAALAELVATYTELAQLRGAS